METNHQINYCDVKQNRYTEPFALHPKKYSEWLQNPQGKYFFIVPIRDIFRCEEKINQAKNNPNVFVLFTDVLEGYALRYFKYLHKCTEKYNCAGNIIFATCLYKVEQEYQKWLVENNLEKTFDVLYYPEWYHRVYDNLFDYELDKYKIIKRKLFSCLNNRLRAHRVQTVAYLNHHNLIEKGVVSCLDNHYEEGVGKKTPKELIFPYSESYKQKHLDILAEQQNELWKKLPLNVDTEDFANGSRPHDYNKDVYNDCLFNIVTETHYHPIFQNHHHIFLSEKMWKPIVCKQAFIVIGPKYTLKYLKSLGFLTFSCIINESYDSEDEDTRLFSAIDALAEAQKKYSVAQMNSMTKEIRKHNLKNFVKIQKEMIKTCW